MPFNYRRAWTIKGTAVNSETTRRQFLVSITAFAAALAAGADVAFARSVPASDDGHVVGRRFRGGDEVDDSGRGGSGGGSNSGGGGGSDSSGGGSSSGGGGHSGDSSGGGSSGGSEGGGKPGGKPGGKGSSGEGSSDDERFGSKR